MILASNNDNSNNDSYDTHHSYDDDNNNHSIALTGPAGRGRRRHEGRDAYQKPVVCFMEQYIYIYIYIYIYTHTCIHIYIYNHIRIIDKTSKRFKHVQHKDRRPEQQST